MLPKEAVCLLLLALTFVAVQGENRFYYRHQNQFQNRRSYDTSTQSSNPPTSSSTFDPDVLNRFLEEYASKIKKTTEKPRDEDYKSKPELLTGEIMRNTNIEILQAEPTTQNDTMKRQKYYSSSSPGDERNSGWVTLDAIPWSKSKISKWQANPTSQRPWPDPKPWDKPSYSSSKPWNPDYSSRPSTYESKPWQNKVTKPHWSDNTPQTSNKPWYSESQRPGYIGIDKYEENPSQAQKWPPERPSWDRYPESSRPSSDIITDNGPPNFPTSHWDRPGPRPTYSHQTETYVSESNGWHDRNEFPNYNKYQRPSSNNNNNDDYYDRPHFSQYQYPASGSEQHPPNHPASGDGHWVVLSTNRGYSKSRQRSIKFEGIAEVNEAEKKKHASSSSEEDQVPAVTSKRSD